MKTTLILTCALFVSFLVQSQEAVTVSGGKGTGTGGTSSYTLGQVFYTEATGGNGSISQGVQQSFELFTLSNPELTTVNLKAVTYPNPTTDYVMLNITDNGLTNLSYNLIDVQGRVLSNEQISDSDTQISMKKFSIGMYVLKVNQNNNELKTFKIIKK